MQRDPLTGFVDDRWKDQLGRLERFYFDVLLGEKHTELGYTRDVFGDDEIQALIGEHAARVAVKQEFDFPPGSIDAYLAKRHGGSLGEPIIATMQLGGRGARFRRIARRSVKAMLRMFKPGEERLTPGEIARAVHRKMTYRFSPPAPLRPPQDFTSPLPGIPVPDSGTFYFDEVPQELSSQISPYIVRCGQSTRATIKSILRPSHYNLFEAYGPDYAGKGCHRIVADPPQRYRELLKGLLAIQGTRFMMARDLVNYRPSKNEIICHVRHDVDGDIDSALQQAGIEASLGIQTTYYILHTAPYYGDWDGAIFERHEAMAKVYKKIQGLGHEVALHTDGLGLYRFQKTDGAAGVKAELAWLRSNGLKITGTAGHNSAGVYGAENFALFKGRPLSTLAPAGPIAVIHNGRGGLLQQLDEKSLGLDYEANDIFLQKEVPIQYFALRGANDWRHQVYNPDKIPDFPEQLWNGSQWHSQEEVIDCLAAGPRNVYAIFAVHPEFYGLRSAHDASAVMNCEAPAKQNLTSLGWRGFAANEISQRYERAADKSDRQSVVKINELGFADVPPAYIAGCARRFVFLGKDNIATDFTSDECKLPQAFIREIRRKDAMLWGATALAGKLTPIAVRIAWLSRLLETEKIDDVILSVGLSDLITEDRDQLMSIWGLTRDQAALLLPDELSPQALHAITASTFVGSSTPKIDSAGRILVDEIVNGGKERGPAISRRLNTALTLLQSFGLRTTLLVEDCGENMGLSWIAASQSERVRRVVTAQAVFEPVAQSSGISLVNPYQAFLDYQGLAPSHWPTDGQWAIHAHTLAAHALRRTTLLATTGAK